MTTPEEPRVPEEAAAPPPDELAPAADPNPLFTREEAELIVPRRQFAPVYSFFARHTEALTAALEHRMWGFAHVELRENLDNFGLYLMRMDYPVPFLWLGLGWGSDDAPGTLPSWGASLEVNGSHVRAYKRDVAGLRPAFELAAQHSEERAGVYMFDAHVELAEWRSFEWLLKAPNQLDALLDYWESYLELLARNGVPEAIDAFIEAEA